MRREISGRGETDGLNVVVRVTCDSRVPTQLPVLYAKVPKWVRRSTFAPGRDASARRTHE